MKFYNRQELYGYTERRLGSPIMVVDVDITQMDDRFDDAVEFYHSTLVKHMNVIQQHFDLVCSWDDLDEQFYINNQWVRDYFTALVHRNWVQNLTKCRRRDLMGGVKIDVATMRSLAEQAISKLEVKLEAWS